MKLKGIDSDGMKRIAQKIKQAQEGTTQSFIEKLEVTNPEVLQKAQEIVDWFADNEEDGVTEELLYELRNEIDWDMIDVIEFSDILYDRRKK